jgi:hypothetical protein
LAEQFFRPENGGRRVYLYATRELVERIGHESGAGFQDFIECVKGGPAWAHRAGLCQRVLEAMNDWRSRKLPYPPYIASLSLFAIAAGLEGDFEPHEYYGRLWQLLGINDSGMPASFDKMLRVWEDLERWSAIDKAGELGVFKADFVGKWIHVGVPLAQTLLSEEERHVLPRIFARAALDPTAPPASEEIETLLRGYGRGTFRAKTLRVLVSKEAEQQENKRALLQTVTSELRSWDGTLPGEDGAAAGNGISNWPLRLCCDLDKTARRAVMSLRCKAPKEFPEAGFTLVVANEQNEGAPKAVFTCEEWGFGWSTPLEDEYGRKVDAARFDWLIGVELEDQSRRWKFRLPASPVRIFVDGSTDGLGSFIEVRSLPVSRQFYICAAPGALAAISEWGASSCDDWTQLDMVEGLPPNWRLFSAARARTDEPIKSKYPNVALPTFVEIVLRGGIRISRAYRYFSFAPPMVVIQGVTDKVTFNGVTSSPRETDGRYEVPENLPAPTEGDPDMITILAWRGENVADRATIFISKEGWSWVDRSIGLRLDTFGDSLESDATAFLRGSSIIGLEVPAFNSDGIVPLAPEGSVHYVGREPGQIIHWPNEPLPSSWSPVWVIVSRRTGEIIFCGGDLAECEPLAGVCGDRHKLKMWKEYVWVRRKKLRTPTNPTVSALWKRYQAIAKNV